MSDSDVLQWTEHSGLPNHHRHNENDIEKLAHTERAALRRGDDGHMQLADWRGPVI